MHLIRHSFPSQVIGTFQVLGLFGNIDLCDKFLRGQLVIINAESCQEQPGFLFFLGALVVHGGFHGFLIDRSLSFTVHRAKLDTPYVLADAVRIREVLVNILSNAVKFTPDGGSIRFETDYRPGGDDRHIVVRYRIADTGVGMSEEFLEKVFDDFAQEETGARTQYKGTGLGMAITKQYVDMMGGTITVESKKEAALPLQWSFLWN